ncbi:4-hydroxyphenylpyruvate dioxygenase [Nonomuraea lactucae]|uniref:4-hydroxyphenylpyruvate dioxygenase n=1 Tax=Nonomuraea lactucae TaxID=2249762 RepID=UPI0019655D14|nr:4-hydroxyphenylpyruvate dioxygenase [Nonomuraea lactucae]
MREVSGDGVLNAARLNHVEFYVADAGAAAGDMAARYGFETAGASDPGEDGPERSVAIRQGTITLVFTSASTPAHPVSEYVDEHGDGVAAIGLRVDDARAAFQEAVSRGARPVAEPAPLGGGVAASVQAFGDVVLRFVQLPEGADGGAVPWLAPAAPAGAGGTGLEVLDHFAVCLPSGDLDPHVDFFETVMGFETIFAEHTVVGDQVMDSKVVQNAAGDVTLVLLEPGHKGGAPGQVDEFVKANSGPGVQHIAFSTEDIVGTVGTLKDREVEFLDPPASYYELVDARLNVTRHTLAELQRLNILADEDHDGELFQSFTRPATPRRTYFFEVIERAGATTFGSGNIKALYEAVELEQSRQRS